MTSPFVQAALFFGLVPLFLRGSSQFFMVIVGFWFFGQL
jgi:hypothetical protein